MKRWLCLSVTLLVISFAAAAMAEGTDPKICGSYEYMVLENGSAQITRYSGQDTEVVIPETVDGIKVTEIGEYAFDPCV